MKPYNLISQLLRCRLLRIVRGVLNPLDVCGNYQKMKELEAMMQYWHRQETGALFKAQEALACGSLERCAMWLKRAQEARMRCNKDFRRPMEKLTGKPDLFSEIGIEKLRRGGDPK